MRNQVWKQPIRLDLDLSRIPPEQSPWPAYTKSWVQSQECRKPTVVMAHTRNPSTGVKASVSAIRQVPS